MEREPKVPSPLHPRHLKRRGCYIQWSFKRSIALYVNFVPATKWKGQPKANYGNEKSSIASPNGFFQKARLSFRREPDAMLDLSKPELA